MKKIIKLKENDLNNIVKKVIEENERSYGNEDINKLYSSLKDDEYVDLDDVTGELSGAVISKKEYLIKMLKTAIRDKDWSKVRHSILFIETQMK